MKELNEQELERQQVAEKYKNDMQQFQLNLKERLSDVCKIVVEERFHTYEKVCRAFQKVFNRDELDYVISRKADIEHVERMQESKAQKSELIYQNAKIEAVNERIKHLSILMAELAMANVPSKASSSFKGGENINTTI